VRARDQSKDGPGLGAIDDDHGNVCCRIDSCGNFEVADGFLSRGSRSCADGERRSLGRGKDWKKRENDEGNESATK
jgi:hypothetical protein